ncbi:MAG TPA: argininosuccinate synthase, partial [Cyclobacteriaceae bacterium]|nr:argininosuccinate synthase [Cyclobacteriaceae bacterium]
WLHEGQYFDPVMRDIEAFLHHSQQNVTGEVSVTLFPHYFQINGIHSPYDLMSAKFGKYGEMNLGWTGEDVKGFTKIFANPAIIHHQVMQEANNEK